jgi:hypothetical protein
MRATEAPIKRWTSLQFAIARDYMITHESGTHAKLTETEQRCSPKNAALLKRACGRSATLVSRWTLAPTETA